jgi:hypothetical protein
MTTSRTSSRTLPFALFPPAEMLQCIPPSESSAPTRLTHSPKRTPKIKTSSKVDLNHVQKASRRGAGAILRPRSILQRAAEGSRRSACTAEQRGMMEKSKHKTARQTRPQENQLVGDALGARGQRKCSCAYAGQGGKRERWVRIQFRKRDEGRQKRDEGEMQGHDDTQDLGR